MIVVLPFSDRELVAAKVLLRWCAELDGVSSHRVVLLASSGVTQTEINLVHEVAKTAFAEVTAIKQQVEEERAWPLNANAMFRLAVQWNRQHGNGHWLWLECDCAPIVSGWLALLDAEYKQHGRPFMGTTFDKPYRHFNGVMIYPQNVDRYNPYMTHSASVPFDCNHPELTMRVGYNTAQIQRSLANTQTNTPHTFPDIASLAVVKDGVALFHGCKDGTLIERLRERRAAASNGHQAVTVVAKATAAVRRLVKGGEMFYHSGNLGDIIYGLYAIELRGGGSFIVGPTQNGTAPCSIPVNQDQFNLLQPLLKAQPYLKSVSWHAGHPGEAAVDMNRFRDQWFDIAIRNRTEISNLCKMHCFNLGVDHLFRENNPWLTVPNPIWTGKIIVARSVRHRATDFPWSRIVAKYADRLLFVGHTSEWQQFQTDFKCKVSYYGCRDFLEMARVIAGGEMFVGNQSFPLAIAAGLGQRIFCEAWPSAADCYFTRPNFIDQRKSNFLDFESMLTGRSALARIPRPDKLITIRRSKALGDVLASTFIATALTEKGYEVEFQAVRDMHPVLQRHPDVKVVSEPTSDPDVNLDGAYEDDPDRATKHFASIFVERTNEQLLSRGIKIEKAINFAPRIKSNDDLRMKLRRKLELWPKPWVMICPRSWHWANRTVPNDIWHKAAEKINGTKFWLGNDTAPHGVQNLNCKKVDELIEYIACADVLATVDSGPAHIGIALGVPTVVVGQSSDPALHFSDQRDWVAVYPPLDCLNCQLPKCPIDEKRPPCQSVESSLISNAVNARLRGGISAVIAVYKPKHEVLMKALECVMPQVDEVVIVGDLDSPLELERIAGGKIKFVRMNETATGYGRKLNRGVRESSGEFIWATNDDCFPDSDVAEKLMDYMGCTDVGAVTYTLLYPDRRIQFAGIGRPQGAIGFGHRWHRQPEDVLVNAASREEETICGASVLLRRKAFYDAGAMDEAFYLYSEDASLGLQLRRAGWRIIYEPNAKGIHLEHQSTGLMGDISPILAQGHEIFRERWEAYFLENPDVTKLGTFGYLKKG